MGTMPIMPFPAHCLICRSHCWCLAVLTVPSPLTMLCSLLPMLLNPCIVAALDDPPHSRAGIKLLSFSTLLTSTWKSGHPASLAKVHTHSFLTNATYV
jgi:hypothetical protein